MTCATRKGPSHTGDCPNDTALQQLVTTANTEQWQRCKRFVELGTGCNHMTCHCGAHFCYLCGRRWKTCRCPQSDEPRLLNRAAQILDRNANSRCRLFEPQRVLHTLPVSWRPSGAASEATIAGPAVRRGTHAQSVASPASSVWQSDFEDRSEWGHDWTDDDGDEPVQPPEQPTAAPAIQIPDVAPAQSTACQLRDLCIAEAVEHLRENHECEHEKWRWVRGGHQCEECFDWLREYIFELQTMSPTRL